MDGTSALMEEVPESSLTPLAKRQQSVNQEGGSQQTQNLPAP